jgi:hypothetical protein
VVLGALALLGAALGAGYVGGREHARRIHVFERALFDNARAANEREWAPGTYTIHEVPLSAPENRRAVEFLRKAVKAAQERARKQAQLAEDF